MKRLLRTAQCYLPDMRAIRWACHNFAAERFGLLVDEDFTFLSRMAPVGLALDIGANWGQSIAALKGSVRPAKIVSFEPNPVLGARLARLYAGDPAVEVRREGLADAPGAFTLYVPSYNGKVFDGLGSFDEREATTWLGPWSLVAFDAAKLRVDRHDVPVGQLDQFGFDPDVVKIDVQGLEEQVVQGGLKMFARAEPATIVERPKPSLVALFASIGMRAYRAGKGGLVPDDVGGLNTLFLSRGRAAALGA